MITARHTAAAKVAANWDSPPEWVRVLARECDATSQASAARRIGYSGAVVSTLLANRYKGDLTRVEKAVCGAFLHRTVACPVLGEIAANRCLKEQRKPLDTSSPQSAQLYRACRSGCPHSHVSFKGRPHDGGGDA